MTLRTALKDIFFYRRLLLFLLTVLHFAYPALQHEPYVQDIKNDSAVICFSFNAIQAGMLQYGETPKYTRQVGFKGKRQYSIKIYGLKENTKYYYALTYGSGSIGYEDKNYYFITSTFRGEHFIYSVIGDT
ncbi:hypothetical protein ACFL6D_05075, partial [Spirochaetota bacterium]